MKDKTDMSGFFTKAALGILFVMLAATFSPEAAATDRLTTNFKLKDLSGRELALKDFRGKIILLLFGELYQQNTLKALHDVKKILTSKRSYREAVEVLLIITERRKPEEYMRVKGGLEITYPILIDDERNVYAQYEIIAIPTTFVINRKGIIKAKLPSYTISYYDQVDAELSYLLGEITKEELDSVMHPHATPPYKNGKTERILSLAENLKDRGFYESAADSYRQVLERDPSLKAAHIGLGTIYLDKKEVEKAEKEFQTVLETQSDDPGALKGIVQVHLLRGETDKAAEIMNEVLLSNYVDDDIYYIMGKIHEKQGNLKEAVRYYKMTCEKLLRKR